MTVVQPAVSHPIGPASVSGTGEPSRFTAYATGCWPEPTGVTDRLLVAVERLLVPQLGRLSRRRVSPARARS